MGHAYSTPVEWGCDVEVFGQQIQSGQLVHADKHGFMAIPPEDEEALLDASVFMDQNECNTVIAAARSTHGKSIEEILESFSQAGAEFGKAAKEKFNKGGEWS